MFLTGGVVDWFGSSIQVLRAHFVVFLERTFFRIFSALYHAGGGGLAYAYVIISFRHKQKIG
jgi:hypothetical protein